MTKFSILLVLVAVVTGCSNELKAPPHTPPDERVTLTDKERAQAGSLSDAIKMGERNLAWLSHINSKLKSGPALSFSSKATMTGYPIETPNRYSDKIALDRYELALKEMPAEMYKVLIDGEPFTDQPPVDLKTYLEWGLKLDKVYQTSARWIMMQPYLSYLTQRRKEDVRGYYFLNAEPDLENKLRNFRALTVEDQTRLEQWLLLLCFNTEASESVCSKKLKAEKALDRVLNYFTNYQTTGEQLFESYFDITIKRTDIAWHDSSLVYPFRDPKNDPVETYLKVNIEDEWKWKGWNLVLKFTPDAATHVEFVAGSTPHVDGLAGSKITMDANAPLTEWDVQWTIRHEFGHSLGFPDCYIEFYEPSSREIINYQIDTSNLMCSRMGVLQEKHYDELKRVYTVK